MISPVADKQVRGRSELRERVCVCVYVYQVMQGPANVFVCCGGTDNATIKTLNYKCASVVAASIGCVCTYIHTYYYVGHIYWS